MRTLVFLSTSLLASALRLPQAPPSEAISRRQLAQQTLAAGALSLLRPAAARADEEMAAVETPPAVDEAPPPPPPPPPRPPTPIVPKTFTNDDTFNSMGGSLVGYVDAPKGYKLYKPTAWNQFDTDPGVYDVKFVDLIEPSEIVQVSSSPVAKATSVDALGEPADVGVKLAASRKATLVSAAKREVDGFLVYTVELEGPEFHEYQTLSINKGKLYRLSTVTTSKRWSKRKELYKNIALSFVPKGF